MSLESGLKKFEEFDAEFDANIITHEINCPVCRESNTITTVKYDPANKGQISCPCGIVYVYKILPKYEILTATVNEFKDNQL